jgi:uncharacterized protein (TIGR03437 family)
MPRLKNVLIRTVYAFALIPGLAMAAVPTIQGVTDSAGYGPRVAPGSIASLFGTGLASGTAQASGFPLPTTLGGASISVGGVLVPLFYVSPGQINFQVPSATESGDADVVVNGPGGASASFSFTVTAQAPAIYQYGTNQAVAQNADGTLNSDGAPAAAGSVITVYLTGQGAVNNPVTDGTATPSSTPDSAVATATATIGAQSANVTFLGLTPEFAGLAQANIQVPTLPTGDYPLVITVGGLVSASAVVSVSGSGTAYTSPLTLVGSVAFANSDPSSIAFYDGIAYICGEDQIEMVNVTIPTAPAIIGSFGASTLNGFGDRCAINTTAATPFLVEIVGSPSSSQESFAVFSLSNPESPSLLTVEAITGGSTHYGHIVDLSFYGNYGIATTSYLTYYTSNDEVASQTGDFLVFDFTNPASPVFFSYMQPSSLPGSSNQNLKPYANVVDQVYAYVASSSATGASTAGTGILDVIGIAVPGTPSPIAQVRVSQAAILLSFDIAGTTLLAAGNTTGQRDPGTPDFDFTGYLTLITMDLTNVQAPAIVATLTTSLQVNGTFYTAAFANGVFAIVNNPPDTDNYGPSSLMIVDARTPSTILLYPYQTQFGFSGILTTSGGYLFAPTALGLNIYQLQL